MIFPFRSATNDDAAFALRVTEACMRAYAEQTWGSWDGRADLNLEYDKIIRLDGTDIGIIGVEPHSDHWFIEKLCASFASTKLIGLS
jgi:hypothetical protein